MKKSRNSEKKTSFSYHSGFLKFYLNLARYSMFFALGLGITYLVLSVFNPSSENKTALAAFAFLPFIWVLQWLILREFKKEKSHIQMLRKILIPYFIMFLAYAVVLCYLAVINDPYVANLNAQVCILINLFFHIALICIMLYSLYFRYNRISIVIISLVENLAFIVIPILQIASFGINIYIFIISGLLWFNPYYFFYGVAFFLWLPITSFSFIFLLGSQIRAASQVYPEWRDAFPNLSDRVEPENELEK